MPQSNKNYYDSAFIISLSEAILELIEKLKDPSLSTKERKFFLNQYSSLLEDTSKELRKPHKRELLTLEEKKYYGEPYLSYFEELLKELNKPLKDELLRPKLSKKTKEALIKGFEEGENEPKKEIIRFIEILNKKIPKIEHLEKLHLSNEEENNERDMRCEMELLSIYFISKFIYLRKKFIYNPNKLEKEQIKNELIDKEEKALHFERAKFLLDKIIDISAKLKDQSLSEEEIAQYNQEREKLRKVLKMEIDYEAHREMKTGKKLNKDFKDFHETLAESRRFLDAYKKNLILKRLFDRFRN